MQDSSYLYWFAAAISVLFIAWTLRYGWKRGVAAWLCRVAWITPLILTFFPEAKIIELPSSVSVKPIHILVDDSQSMRESGWLEEARELVAYAKEECLRLGCRIDVKNLSDYDDRVTQGFSPLHTALPLWSLDVGGDYWLLLSDGGSMTPQASWSQTLTNLASNSGEVRGLINYFFDRDAQNIWIKTSDAGFSFEGKTTDISVVLRRQNTENELPVQVRIQSGSTYLTSSNVSFKPGDSEISFDMRLAPLSRGNHFLNIEALPVAGENITWDNTTSTNLEILPNTIGVLHLLGSPSWDGRFVRRYLKSEPKYDLISFFILRDPIDMQVTNERELSLIPFPVDRLFNQELPNFRSLILQNFSLYQFLEPSYQKNLVEFVKNGGGLIFIGGPRALQMSDFQNSPLAEILPFETSGSAGLELGLGRLRNGFSDIDQNGPYYDSEIKFTIEAAEPDLRSRDLANIYDDWLQLLGPLKKIDSLQGLHRTDKVEFKKDAYTPLLNARTEDGRSMPLAVASYPGKGRALWIFSDSFWRVAMSPEVSRQVYYQFLNNAMTWVLRQEFRKPLNLSSFQVQTKAVRLGFELGVSGPAAAFLDQSDDWSLSICDSSIEWSEVSKQKTSAESWLLSGQLGEAVARETVCTAELQGIHPSFGSVSARVGGQIPRELNDTNSLYSAQAMRDLSLLTGASAVDSGRKKSILQWIEAATGNSGIAQSVERQTLQDHYWIFDKWMIYLLFLAIPLEVFIRRWPQLTSLRVTQRSQ